MFVEHRRAVAVSVILYAGRSTWNRGTRHICPLSKHIRDYSVIIKTVFIYNLF